MNREAARTITDRPDLKTAAGAVFGAVVAVLAVESAGLTAATGGGECVVHTLWGVSGDDDDLADALADPDVMARTERATLGLALFGLVDDLGVRFETTDPTLLAAFREVEHVVHVAAKRRYDRRAYLRAAGFTRVDAWVASLTPAARVAWRWS